MIIFFSVSCRNPIAYMGCYRVETPEPAAAEGALDCIQDPNWYALVPILLS